MWTIILRFVFATVVAVMRVEGRPSIGALRSAAQRFDLVVPDEEHERDAAAAVMYDRNCFFSPLGCFLPKGMDVTKFTHPTAEHSRRLRHGSIKKRRRVAVRK